MEIVTNLKYCPRCKLEKQFFEFHKDKSTSDKFCTYCKDCNRNKRGYKALAYIRTNPNLSYCKYCKLELNIDNFYNHNKSKCKTCYKRTSKEYNAKASSKIWRRSYEKRIREDPIRLQKLREIQHKSRVKYCEANKEKILATCREKNKRSIALIEDSYINLILRRQGLDLETLTPEYVKLRKSLIHFKRALKEIKHAS